MGDTNYQWAAHYTPAGSRCSGRAMPGALALRKALAHLFDPTHPASKTPVHGLYNCRTVRGRSTPSMHGTGRAIDYMTSGSHGDRVLDALGAQGDELGIQFVIWNRQKYGPRYAQGASYGGVSPHTDHLHIELTPEAAASLTYDRAVTLLGSGYPTWLEDVMADLSASEIEWLEKFVQHSHKVGVRASTLAYITDQYRAARSAAGSWERKLQRFLTGK